MSAVLGLTAIALVACGSASPRTTTQEKSAAPVRVYYYRGTGLGSTDFYVRTR